MFTKIVTAIGGAVALSIFSWLAAPQSVGAEASAKGCQDPLAKAPHALFCVKHSAGYALFKDSMSPPNENYYVHSDEGLEIIVFDTWVVISRDKGSSHTIIPRERFVYSANEEFGALKKKRD